MTAVATPDQWLLDQFDSDYVHVRAGSSVHVRYLFEFLEEHPACCWNKYETHQDHLHCCQSVADVAQWSADPDESVNPLAYGDEGASEDFLRLLGCQYTTDEYGAIEICAIEGKSDD